MNGSTNDYYNSYSNFCQLDTVRLDVIEARRAINLGLARAEQVEVGTIEEQNAGHFPPLSANS